MEIVMKSDQTTIWITGASSGIGASLAKQLAAADVRLILSARDEGKLKEVAKCCELKGASTEVAVVDLTDTVNLATVADQVLDKHENIDVLILCAGVSQRSYAFDTTMQTCRKIMDLNFFSVVALTQKVVPKMLANKCGKIVVISSVAGKLGTPLRSSYSASKHALHGYFDSLRAELSSFGISVTIVCPGFIQTNITLNSLLGDGSKYNKVDEALKNGVPVEKCARRIIKGFQSGEEEFIVSGLKEKTGALLKRFFPVLLSKIVRRVNTV
jgi:dehydrogenase/reductase SDR family member 7B